MADPPLSPAYQFIIIYLSDDAMSLVRLNGADGATNMIAP